MKPYDNTDDLEFDESSDYDFDSEFELEEDEDEDGESHIWSFLAQEYKKAMESSKVYPEAINPKRVTHLLQAKKILEELIRGTDIKLTCNMFDSFIPSIGGITLIGKDITFLGNGKFFDALKLTSCFEVTPRTDGTVRVDFTFHGLTIPIE